MAEEKVRLGIIGCGAIAPTYIYALQNNPKSKVVSLADENFENLKDKSDLLRVCRTYNNYKHMVDNENLDAVVIATPPYAHKEQALYCAKKGLDILCEKPLTVNLNDVEEIIDGCRNVKTSIMLQRRFYPASKAIKEAFEKDLFGEIKKASIDFRCNKKPEFYASWRGKKDLAGGGALISQALHRIDQMVYFFGKPIAVEGIMQTFRKSIEVEDYAKGKIYFDNGVIVDVETTTSDEKSGNNTYSVISIEGTNGKAVLSDDKALEWTIKEMPKPIDGNLSAIPLEYRPAYYGPSHEIIINDFVDAIKSNRKPIVSMEDSLLDMKIIFGFYESAKNGGRKVLI